MKYREQNNFNLDKFISDMASAPWYMAEQSTDPNEASSAWYGLFEQVLKVPCSNKEKGHTLAPAWTAKPGYFISHSL